MEKASIIAEARSAVDGLERAGFPATAEALREVNKLIEQADQDLSHSGVGGKVDSIAP